jgi:chromosome segregation ATPase
MDGLIIAGILGASGIAVAVLDQQNILPFSNNPRKLWFFDPARYAAASIVRTIPEAMPMTYVPGNRSLTVVKADLEKRMWEDQNATTKAISYVRKLTDDLQKGYPLSPEKVETELRGIAQSRIGQLKARKNQGAQRIETLERQKKALNANITLLEEEISKVSLSDDSPKKQAPGLWLTKDGRLLEEKDLLSEDKRARTQRQARVEQLQQQIGTLKSQMPKMDELYKEYREASDALQNVEQEYQAIGSQHTYQV